MPLFGKSKIIKCFLFILGQFLFSFCDCKRTGRLQLYGGLGGGTQGFVFNHVALPQSEPKFLIRNEICFCDFKAR